jgi:hypothetical protein
LSETVDHLILDLLEWIGPGARPYAESMDAWRTSCPRLPVWEDATEQGLIARRRAPGEPALVSLTTAGEAHLRRGRPGPGPVPIEPHARHGDPGR